MPVKFGLIVPQGWDLLHFPDPVEKYEVMTQVAQEAERVGYDSIWLYDHLHTVPLATLETVFECWTSCAGLARDTKTIRIGQMVTCNGYRNPALLAKMASTLDVISHGRLDFGIGAGYAKGEFLSYGYDFPEGVTRGKMLGEALQIIHALWSEPYATFAGKFYQIKDAINEPKGVQKPHPPIWVGGDGEKLTLKLVAQYADACNIVGFDPALYRHKFAILRQHCDDVGRDYNSIRKTSQIFLNLTDNPTASDPDLERLPRPLQRMMSNQFLIATPEMVIERLHELIGAGVETFILYLYKAAHLEPLQRFAEEIMPAFR